MRPKYRRFTRSLPLMITITLGAPCLTNAAIFNDDTGGNATPSAVENGETTVIADGGTSASPLVSILNGVNLNGQDDQFGVLVLSGANPYRVNVESGGSLVANSTQNGIASSIVLNLDNSGTISGLFSGVDTVGGGVINNYGLISGSQDAIRFTSEGGTVNNYSGASILGVDGSNSDGIEGEGFNVNNYGIISGNDDGIFSNTNLAVYNYSGSITGVDDGIDANGSLYLENYSTITATSDSNGVEAGTDSIIFNYAGGTITGGSDGIDGRKNITITNDGIVIGNGVSGDAIELGGNSRITNTGTLISNGDDAIDIAGPPDAGDTITLTNSGQIVAFDNAFEGNISDDTLNLNFGSRLIGGVVGDGGTDTINFNGGLSSYFDSASGAFSNSILGDINSIGTINKSDSGVAFIGVPGNGGFTISDAPTINITGGGLYMNADILGGATINAGGAALGGTGTWDSTVNITAGGISAGSIPINLDLDPTNAVGTLNLVGNVTHSAGSFIRHDLIPGGADDLITHTGGTYSLGANTGIRVSATDNDTVVRNGTYTVVDSDAFITGGFPDMSVQFNTNVNDNDSGLVGSLTGNTGVGNTTAVLNQFMSSDFTDGGTNLVFTVDHDFEGLAGLSSNASALGAALDNSIDNPNSDIQDFIAALDYSDLGTVQATLESVIPDNVLGIATGLATSNYRLHRVVEDHLAMARSSGGTIVETPATTDAKGGTIPAQVTSTGGGAWNAWGTVSYDWTDSDLDTTDIDGEDASFTAGIDYRVAPNLLLGILFDGSQADYDHTGGGSDIDSYRFSLYGTYGESTGLYANFLAGYGDHDIDGRRSLGGILAGSSYSASTDADSLQALLSVGYNMESGCVKHGPFAGLEYQNIDVDGFASTGSGAFGSVGDFDVESLRLLIGYRAETTYGKFTPFGSIAYAHEFEDGSVSTTATIPGGASFRFNGGGVDSAVLIALGTGYSISENLSASAAYHGEYSTGDGISSDGLSVGLNYNF